MMIRRQVRLGGLLVAAAALGVVVTFALGHSQAGTSQAAIHGAMAVDCDASQSGIQLDCTYLPGATFQMEVHVTVLPVDMDQVPGYVALQAKVGWTAGVVNYLPTKSPTDEALWPECTIAPRTNNWTEQDPPVPSVFIGCAPFPDLPAEDTFTGAIFTFAFQCKSAPGPNQSVLELISAVNEPFPAQGGTTFTNIFLETIDPALAGATVTCAAPPTATPVGPTPTEGPSPTPTITPTPTDTPPPTNTPTPTPLPDTDDDGIPDVDDNCLEVPNFDQLDGDNDDIGDLCDPETPGDEGSVTGDGDLDIEVGDSTVLTFAVVSTAVPPLPVSDIACTFSIVSPAVTDASLDPETATSDGDGNVSVTLTAGSIGETVWVMADCGTDYGTSVLAVVIATEPTPTPTSTVEVVSPIPTATPAVGALPQAGSGSAFGSGISIALWAMIGALVAAAAAALSLYGWRYARSRKLGQRLHLG